MKNDIIQYAAASYGFLLPKNGEFTFQFWAGEIRKAYDLAQIRTSVIVKEIEKTPNKTILKRENVCYLGEEIDKLKESMIEEDLAALLGK